MRRALNENPLVQAGAIGVLALLVGVLFLMRMGGGPEAPPSEEPSPPAEAAAAADAGTGAASSAAPADPAAVAPDATTPPADASVPPSTDAIGAPSGGFEAGPGLPQPVVSAYDSGKVVALLVVRENGIDDRKLRAIVERLSAQSGTELFVVRAKGIAKYSRIAQGVEVDRTPALVVLTPKALADGPLPTATVAYGFRGPKSVEQAIEDAAYKGPTNLPYHPR